MAPDASHPCGNAALARINTPTHGLSMVEKRLSVDDWIEAGLSALEREGAGALGAEALARKLGRSKGSFYWHFKNLPDFHRQTANAWKRRAAAALVDALESDGPADTRLRQIGDVDPAEPAMRAWARQSETAAAELEEIDTLRLDAMAAVLRDYGISNPEIARALYAAEIGFAALPGSEAANGRAMSTLVDLVLALR